VPVLDKDIVMEAFRNCITDPKCKNCPWVNCDTLKNKKVEIPVDLALEVNNLLSQDYEVIVNYPMPKRNYMLSLTVEY
jgi:hypothetical protein